MARAPLAFLMRNLSTECQISSGESNNCLTQSIYLRNDVALKTVFVVGAGASFEFGLPIGNDLKNQIGKALAFDVANYRPNPGKGDGYLFETIQSYAQYNRGGQIDPAKFFLASSHISSAMVLAPSIDNFIHAHNGNSEVEFCGKLAIAHLILRAESKSKLRFPSETIFTPRLDWSEETWLVALLKLICEDCNLEKLPARLSGIKFIIFNYDRCIEHFIYHAIQLYYGMSPADVGKIVNNIEFFHPYGVVGKLPWQSVSDIAQSMNFGGGPTRDELIKIAAEIKTFTEGTDSDSSDVIAIRRSMEQAERIVFLGFAYHRLNVELLLGPTAPERTKTRRVIGTAYGMSDDDARLVRDDLEQRLFAPSLAVRNDVTCVKLFHEYSRALSFV